MSMLRKTLLGLLLLLVALVVLLGLLLSRGKTLAVRHEPLPQAPFDYATGSFADYQRWARAGIAAARPSAGAAEIDNLAPFELVPGPECARDAAGKVEKGVLLIHGLFDSPTSMRQLGEDLRARCLHVLGTLLPAHGTRPGDFLDTHWEDWAEQTRFATAQLAERANTVILSGHSAGGALALLDAHRFPQADALLLFAPALAITPSAQYAKFVVPIGWLFPKAAWFAVEADEAVYRYESISFSSAAETWALIQATQQVINAQQRQLPVFTVASMEDNTVGTRQILAYMAGNSHPLSHTLLYSQHPLPAMPGVSIVSSSAPEQGILSLSHLGLMTPPSHPHYGRNGTYRNCGHYGNEDNPLFVQCKNGERIWYGETTPENRELGVLERIAFNPFYDEMLLQIDEFLAALDR